MQRVWQLQEAKNKLSEVVNEAIKGGPQVITRRGEDVAVVISSREYQQLTTGGQTLYEFFRASPFVSVDLDLSRDKSPVRPDVEL
jgi:prevent-host-death family protein